MLHPDDIPGVADARASEAASRSEAFLGVPRRLCGMPVAALTLHRLGFLVAAGNAFFSGGAVTEKAVVDFAWAVAPEFRIGDSGAYAEFCLQVGNTGALEDLATCVREIGDFLDDSFLDAPAGGGSGKIPVTSSEAVFVELFADAYGWTPEVTLHLSLPQLYQILRRYVIRRDPKPLFINRRSEKARGEWLRSHQAAADAAGSSPE